MQQYPCNARTPTCMEATSSYPLKRRCCRSPGSLGMQYYWSQTDSAVGVASNAAAANITSYPACHSKSLQGCINNTIQAAPRCARTKPPSTAVLCEASVAANALQSSTAALCHSFGSFSCDQCFAPDLSHLANAHAHAHVGVVDDS